MFLILLPNTFCLSWNSLIYARCGLKLQNSDPKVKIKYSSFTSVDEHTFGMDFLIRWSTSSQM